ncbi:MAG: hypothetical protein C4523_00045 [Myxococcales bacterium]|nr:MAG: hypothetical protein C4523_00045 [Myxococcales bacterium]
MTRIQRRINTGGMPIARLADVRKPVTDLVNPDSIYHDIAYSIFITEVRAYRTAILAGDHNDIEATGEAIREAIVRALKGNASPIRLDNDTCGNG